ncbi:MAG: hypothetical protein ACHQ1D_02385 [Nitrososphaerales archaeon]
MIDMFSLTSGIPTYYNQLLSKTDKFLDHSNKFLAKSNSDQRTSRKNYNGVPSYATIKEERIKCGKSCLMCPHGPYYYAYWKDDNGKLKKKYIGTRYDETWKKPSKKRNKVGISLASH